MAEVSRAEVVESSTIHGLSIGGQLGRRCLGVRDAVIVGQIGLECIPPGI